MSIAYRLARMNIAFALLLVASIAFADTPLPGALADFDAYVDGARRTFDVPGIAVAIVKDDALVLERGYGVRKLGDPAPVDAHTLFAIASNTKAFTAASLAILADEGKLSLDDRVIDRLPWFQMSDANVTREMTIRDLLVHRSGLGLGAGDLLFWPASTYTTEEIVQRLRYVPLATSFRSAYAYDNVLYAVAGLVIEQVSGKRWAEFVRERILVPVGMDETRTSVLDMKSSDRSATGHAKAEFTKLQAVEPEMSDNHVAAGGIQSNVHDLAKWMRVQLAGGALSANGPQLFSAERQREMWSLITPIPIAEPAVPELAPTRPNFFGYGEGWFLSEYRGHRLVYHTGGWPGMVSRLTLVPDLKLGVVVLTNQETSGAFNAVTFRALDAFIDAPKTDWTAAFVAGSRATEGRADDSWQRHVAARDKHSKPSLPLARYAGTYRDAWYGDVVLALERGRLVLRFAKTPKLVGDVEHWQHDTFIARWRDRALNADAFVTFALDPDGAIDSVRMQAVSPQTDFSFDFQDLRLHPVVSAAAAR